MSIKLVVFDMAGTTVQDRNEVGNVLRTALETFGFSVGIEDTNKVMGIPKRLAIQSLLEQIGVEADPDLIERIHTVFAERMIAHYRIDPSIAEKDGVRETFYELRSRNIKIGIDTGFSRDIADTIFDRLHWKERNIFDVSITSDEVANGRPYPDMIYKAMQLTGVSDATEVAKVGDTASDMQQGFAAGCRYVIGVTSGAYTREDLLQEPHTHLIHSLKEVLEIIR